MSNIAIPNEVLAALPTPLVQSFHALENECAAQKAHFRQVHRLIDLIESLCKLYTVSSVSSILYVLENQAGEPETETDKKEKQKFRITLAAGLRTPSLGTWWHFARISSEVLKAIGQPHILPGGVEAVTADRYNLKNAFDGSNNLISFRNGYAHGATPSEAACARDMLRYGKKVVSLLLKAEPLMGAELLVVKGSGEAFLARGSELVLIGPSGDLLPGHLYFRRDGHCVDLHPFLTYQEESDMFFFYNDLKDNSATFLNYPNAKRLKDQMMRDQLLKRVPIKEWNNQDSEFAQLIELLTDRFKGRKEELRKLGQFVKERQRGFFVVWGNPGVGKSALLARFSQLMGSAPEVRKEYDPGFPWPEGKIHILEYYVRRGSHTDKASHMLDYLSKRLEAISGIRGTEAAQTDEQRRHLFLKRLGEAAAKLKETGAKLLLIVDGLDEADTSTPLVASLQNFNSNQILALYGARPTHNLRSDFYDKLDRENRDSFDLTGFKNKEDVRAILMERVNKYELNSAYVEAVLEKSEGNPLYLKLLCDALENQSLSLNDIARLPKSMEELYASAMDRLYKTSVPALEFLILLAAARDFLTPHTAARIMRMDEMDFKHHALPHCLEFLYENPLTASVDDYQLFHESLRTYLKNTYPDKFLKKRRRLAEYCADWRTYDGDTDSLNYYHDLAYKMAHAIPHLYEEWQNTNPEHQKSDRKHFEEQILQLTDNPEWRACAFNALGNGEALRVAYTRSQELLLRGSKGQPDAALRKKLLDYALQIHIEPLDLYDRQVEKLKAPLKEGESLENKLRDTVQIAKMGNTPLQKMLLSLLAVWCMEPRPERAKLPDAFREATQPWLEESRDIAIEKLWELSFR